jgi:hypothetical protein
MSETGEQIRVRGLAALRRELGRAGLIRFLSHYEAGAGDYTRERRQLLADLTMDQLRQRTRRVGKRKSVRRGK